MSGAIAIAGVALADVGRVDDKGPYELMAQASRRALAEAGLSPADVDGLASTGQGTLPPADVGEYLGLRPRWVDSTAVGGGVLAWAPDASGLYFSPDDRGSHNIAFAPVTGAGVKYVTTGNQLLDLGSIGA